MNTTMVQDIAYWQDDELFISMQVLNIFLLNLNITVSEK